MTPLELEVLERLAAGQTRSEIELVTELAVSYDDINRAVKKLVDESIVDVAYSSSHETFYKRAEGADARLKSADAVTAAGADAVATAN